MPRKPANKENNKPIDRDEGVQTNAVLEQKQQQAVEYLSKQSWDYFQLHAAQRLTTFNYYIVISSVLTTGMVSTFQKDYRMPVGGLILGIVLFLFSIVFYKLDLRNKHLIKNAEQALGEFENKVEKDISQEVPNITKVFSTDAFETEKRKSQNSLNIFTRTFSYSDCFFVVFSLFGMIGILGAIASFFVSYKFLIGENKNPTCLEILSNLLSR